MAYSEDNPNIIVEFSSTPFSGLTWSGVVGTWSGITKYADFEITDAGIKKTSQAIITLHNENGRFTNPVSRSYLGMYREMRIRADVGVWSGIIFHGNVFDYDPDDYIAGPQFPVRSNLTIFARGKYGQRLARDTITWDYYDRGWTCSGAIVDMLQYPDSTVNTRVLLDLDRNTTMISGGFPTNPSKQGILQPIQDACEYYGYDGYFGDEYVIAGSGAWANLHLRKYRAPNTTLSGANPALHYILSSGLTVCRPYLGIDDVKNYVFAWGGTDVGFPPVDFWTENPISRLSGAWTAIGNCALTQDAVIFEGDGNSLRVTTTAINTDPWCDVNVSTAGYVSPQTPANDTIDLADDRFDELEVFFRLNYAGDDIAFRLIDVNGDTVQNFFFAGVGAYAANIWYRYAASVRLADQGAPTWTLVAPSIAFDWSQVRHVQVLGSNAANIGEYMNVDHLHFVGVGWLIDPITASGYADPRYDVGSISRYGLSVYHHSSDKIQCFEQAYFEALRVLRENRDPFQRIEISKGARVWAQPSETVQVTILPWGISGATYRILERTIRYDAESKLLRTTHDLIVQDAEVASTTIRGEKAWGGFLSETGQ